MARSKSAYDWKKIVDKGYRDENGYLRKDLVEEEADELGELFAEEEDLSSTQLRKFYNEVKALEARINDQASFEENLPHILILKAKANYAYKGGKNSKIPESFKDFLEKNIEVISRDEKYETFANFVTFFETVVGYFYGHGGGD